MPRPRPLYFAYGSNLSVTQMIARCQYNPSVSAKPLAVAHLPNWTWIINQRGYANVVPPSLQLDSLLSEATTTNDVLPSTGVYGLLYAMDPEDEQSLDIYEGVDVQRRPSSVSESGLPLHMRPTEQGLGAYNKWYITVRVVKVLDATVAVDDIERVLVYVDELRIKESLPRDEGFKSYPVRTVISGWDPSFNAITGLNGSGKSNILDAIAFVLGITNMSVMRASNQQDLIYKRGQAGVTKANVTIVFDNSDPSRGPPLYKDYPEITVTRQVALPNVSKYLLNGRKSDLNTIQNIFQSVQLNINNPNFVIMQGRITKVLSMRPQEILGMVEEAAGTRMFEEKKTKAKRTMVKKEKRVNEITSLIDEDITPKLEKLRKEKQSFIQFQKNENDLQVKTKKLLALDWTGLQKKAATKAAEVANRREELSGVNDASKAGKGKIKEAEAQMAALEQRRDKELQKGGKINQLKEHWNPSKVSIQSATIKEEDNSVEDKRSTITQLEASLAEKKLEVEKLQASHKSIKEEHDASQQKLASDDSLLQSLLTGLTSKGDNTSGGGYMGQITQAKTRITQADTEEEQLRTKLAMKQKEADELQKRWAAEERSAGDGKKKVEFLKKELANLQENLSRCGWTNEQEESLVEQIRNLRLEVRNFAEQRDRERSSISSLDFNYTAPHNFDRGKVKGTVGSLVSLDEGNYDKAAALEAAAGGKLYQVIIEDERVGKTLLNKELLLKEQAVARETGGKGHLALSMVGYPEELYNAMAYAFGNTFICDDAEAAKKATFSSARVRSVTLDGDVYEPSGTLSGGSAAKGSGILVKVQAVLNAERQLAEAKQKLAAAEAYSEKMKQKRDTWTALSRQVDMKKHELRLLEEQIEGSSGARIETDLTAVKKTIAEMTDNIKAAQEKKKAAQAEVKKLERDMNEFQDNKEGKIEELRASINKQKSKIQKHSVTVKTQQKELQTATLLLEQIEQDIEKAKGEVTASVSGLEKARKNLQKVIDEKARLENAQSDAQKNLDKEKETVSKYDKELNRLRSQVKKEKDAEADRAAQVVKLEEAILNLDKERNTAIERASQLEEKYDWIRRDYEPPLNRSDIDPLAKANTISQQTGENLKSLKKKVNAKAAHMITDVEKREEALQQNLKTVLADKEKIEVTIEEIDNYKREALEKTWTKVSKYLCRIVTGQFRQLQPPEGQDMMNGLEVKVQLGTVWKQSLTELSGGQRSLIALSLIMALLQFKPAPMYILDEIDAALDLSHTQHIGHLFRTRFKGSQFIVVSLKEGLFTNANVLFKARFRDGTSIVERTAARTR
ncbi:condensin complex subunit SMC2 [Mucidula mucida]|nr:condensin complex subunit SMC2 [Mucidula mucida]